MRRLVALALLLIFAVPLTWIALHVVLGGDGEVTGTVTDRDGEPVGGCIIDEHHRLWGAGGTAEGTASGADGRFRLTARGGWNQIVATCPDGRRSNEGNVVVAFWRDVDGLRLRVE